MFVGYYKSAWDKTIGKPVYRSLETGALYLRPTGNRIQKRYLMSKEIKRVSFTVTNDNSP